MKILVAYATESGSTAEVAERVAGILKSKGLQVELSQVSEVSDVSSYEACVIGAPVMRFSFLPVARKFVEKNKVFLGSIPVALFTLGIIMKEDTPESRKRMAAKLKVVTKHITPVDTGLFGGRYRGNDYRDWVKITAWAEGLVDKLKKRERS